MKDKVVIVTGGSSGLGKYMAKDFVDHGAKVVITGRNEERLEQANQEMMNGEGEVYPIQMDVSKVDDIHSTVQTVLEKWGRIDVLVNNAGVRLTTGVENITEEE